MDNVCCPSSTSWRAPHICFTRRAGSTAAALRVLKASVLALAVGGLLLAYRFAVFLITLYVT